ncbi:MAG: response regulator [Eubacteriales bacterium]
MGNLVLIIEDEESIVDILSFNLQKVGYEVSVAMDGKTGLEKALAENPDLILLDLMLPEMDGFTVCAELRKAGSLLPVVMLTAREGEEDKIKGLESGADDYITKPFAIRELLARVKANIRRSVMPAVETSKGKERLVIDKENGVVQKDGEVIELTQREFDLLCFLWEKPQKPFSREALMEHVWNYEGYVGDVRAVDVAVRRLREKIEDSTANPTFILTKRGQGYYFGSNE